jgi:FtsH-binding integral membrane protein
VLYAFQSFALLSLLGLALAARQHRSPWPFVLGVASVIVLAWSFYGTFSQQHVLYGGLFGLLAATVWNRFLSSPSTPMHA